MKPRKWVVVAALLLIVISGALYQGFRLLERNRNLEKLLVQGISPYIHGTFSVEKVRIGFFAAYLKNVSLSLPLNSFRIKINEVKIGFSLPRLIKYHFNFQKSVSSVILTSPCIDLLIGSLNIDSLSHANPGSGSLQLVALREPPVDYLIVRKGSLRIIDKNGDAFTAGEGLSGHVVDDSGALHCELHGKLGAEHDNLSIDGAISWTGGLHHFSVKLDSAEIKKPLQFKGFTIQKGILCGAMKFTFPDTLSAATLDSRGWFSVGRSTCRFGVRTQETLDSFSTRLSADHANWTIDTVRCAWRGAQVGGKGSVHLAGEGTTGLEMWLRGMAIDSLPGISPDIKKALRGSGTVHAELSRSDNAGPFSIRASVSGIGIGGEEPVATVQATLDRENVSIDSLIVNAPGVRGRVNGTIGIVKPFSCGLKVAARIDSFPGSKGLKGSVDIRGSMQGILSNPGCDLLVSGKGISAGGVQLGDPVMTARISKGRLVFALQNNTFIQCSGSVERLLSPNPLADCRFKIASESIMSLLERRYGVSFFDSLGLEGTIHGWAGAFSASLLARAHSSFYNGGTVIQVEKTLRGISWRMSPVRCTSCDSAISFRGAGRWYGDSLCIDSLRLLDGITFHAKVFALDTPRISGDAQYDIGIRQLARAVRLDMPLDSGILSGSAVFAGNLDNVEAQAEAHIRNAALGPVRDLQADAEMEYSKGALRILPCALRKDGKVFAVMDTITTTPHLRCSGTLENIDIHSFFGSLAEKNKIEGRMTGSFQTSPEGLPVTFSLSAPTVFVDTVRFDGISVNGSIDTGGIRIHEFTASDGGRVNLKGSGNVPFSVLAGRHGAADTGTVSFTASGDLLASVQKNIDGPIGGHGWGSVSGAVSFTDKSFRITRGSADIPSGTLTLRPFVLEDIKNFSLHMNVDNHQRVHTSISGTIRKRTIRIFSSHDIPRGYEPFTLSNLDFGVLQVETSKGGIELHLPGFMDIGERGQVEFAGKDPFSYFTLSGPVDRLKITGTWVLRDIEFTFPFLDTHETPWPFDPSPYVTWEMDLRAGNNNVMYYWDLSAKQRRLYRFIEAYVDQSSLLKIRGRILDNTFQLFNTLSSSKGTIYYGKDFDKNFDVGVEFVPQKLPGNRGYDNLPYLWGSAEASSDTTRFNRMKLTVLVHDPVTNAVSERGRLVDGPTPNFTIHVSSDVEEIPGTSERDFYKGAGPTFTTVGGAGEFVSSFGEQYLHRYFLDRIERKLAKSVGLDVFDIESSIASNYFNRLYNRQFEGQVNQDDLLALANVGVTIGRYFFRDYLFLKARGELIPVDTIVTPEYSIGLEVQPTRYLTMDFENGFYKGAMQPIQYDPKVNLQLRLPITRLRNFFNF